MKLTYAGGQLDLTEDRMRDAFELEQQAINTRRISILGLGKILSEIHENKYHFLYNQEDLSGTPNLSTSRNEEISFAVWVQRTLGMSKTDAYRHIGIYRKLYLPHTDFFDSQPQLPPIRRLDYILGKDVDEKSTLRLLEASTLDAKDWEVEKGVFEGKSEQEATQDALKRYDKIRKSDCTLCRGSGVVVMEGAVNANVHCPKCSPTRGKEDIEDPWRSLTRNLVTWESEEYRRWIVKHPCVITGEHLDIEPMHLTSRGAGGRQDFCNVIPGHYSVHRLQHQKGWSAVFEQENTDMATLRRHAIQYTILWMKEER